MSIANTSIRRSLTLLLVVVSIVVGFGAIRAAAAWTASAAPLTATPASVEFLQTRLVEETARSADLTDRLAALTAHGEELAAALAEAQAQVASDTEHATQLATDLAAAKQKLAKLEASIRAANRARSTTVTAIRATTTRTVTGGEDEHEGEHEGGDDD